MFCLIGQNVGHSRRLSVFLETYRSLNPYLVRNQYNATVNQSMTAILFTITVAAYRSHLWEAYCQGRQSGMWGEVRGAVGWEKADCESSLSTHGAKHGFHLQQLQQSLPIQNRTVQSKRAQQPAQPLTKPWRWFHCLPRQTDANDSNRLYGEVLPQRVS